MFYHICTAHAKVAYFLRDVCRVYPLCSSDHSQDIVKASLMCDTLGGSYAMCLVGVVKLFCYLFALQAACSEL